MTKFLPAVWILLLAAWPLRGDSQSLSDDWAFQPLRHTSPPQPAAKLGRVNTSSHPIDRFIDADLQKRGARRNAEADRPVLIRRVYFDLIGLPPTPEEVKDFIADRQPDAFERVVDRLLMSPQHGERWARHWLDVVRFGESQGFEYDRIRDNAWRYRDYVINAFNSDKPYDRFIREQLAGDVLEPVTQEGIVATGFLVAGPWDQAGSSAASASVRAMVREAELEDIVGTVGQTFLGVTLNCARCHDHKFDPISARDYYRVKAVFQGVRHGERSIATQAEELRREAERAERKAKLREVERSLEQLEATARDRALKSLSSAGRKNEGSITQEGSATLCAPLARWTFETDARDVIGSLHAQLEGDARLVNGRLVLDGKTAFAVTDSLKLPLREKTLEAWVTLSTLEQGGGGMISVETEDGRNFDSIVFAERQARRWIAGSEFYRRSRDLVQGRDESAAPGQLVHVVITYQADHSVVLFRNGQPYGEGYQWTNDFAPFDTFPAGKSRLLLGKRHTGAARGLFAGEIEEARLYDRALSAAEVAASFSAGPDAASLSRSQILAAYTETEKREREGRLTERDRLLALSKEKPQVPMGYAAKPEKPELTYVLHRGESDKPREPVVAGGLSSLLGPNVELGLTADSAEAERRRRFADWVASRDNPLTARTIVNRVWHYHFGQGLAGTPNDLGKMGERPANPELLDWLARWFVSPTGANWSLKKLHRLMVTSASWRASSESLEGKSADNKERRAVAATDRLTRFALRRLEAEVVRDAMLAVSGELNLQMGGAGFRPFRHVGNGGQNEYFANDPVGPEFNRRTVYRLGVHSGRDPMLDSLDCPEFSTRTAVRASTTTPLQSLSLMNNSFVQRQTERLVLRVEHEAGTDLKAQLKRLWLLSYSREPGASEWEKAARLAREHGLKSVAWAVLNSSEFLFVR